MADVLSQRTLVYTYYAVAGTTQAQADIWRDETLIAFSKAVGKWTPAVVDGPTAVAAIQMWLDHYVYEQSKVQQMKDSGQSAAQTKAQEIGNQSSFG
jgi:hypothetical protein